MKIEQLKENIKPELNSIITVKKMGHITELRYMLVQTGGTIQKLNKDSYVDLITGEVKEFKHSKTRLANIESVSRSLRNLRDIINSNVLDVKKCLWITLTYAENMTDEHRLYNDFRKFNMRFQRYLRNNGMPKGEYIAAAEPQGRGAWHLHVILVFPSRKAPYIENAVLSKLWGHGFVSISSIKGIDNVGAYLSSYLSDMDAIKAINTVDCSSKNIKIVEVKGEEDERRKKAIIKGARLRLYPTGFRIYRLSKGIKKPEVFKMTEAEAMQEVKGAVLTYEKTIQLKDTQDKTINKIYYRRFNKRAKRIGEANSHEHSADYWD